MEWQNLFLQMNHVIWSTQIRTSTFARGSRFLDWIRAQGIVITVWLIIGKFRDTFPAEDGF